MSRGAVAEFNWAKMRRTRSACWAWIPDLLPVSKNRPKPLCLKPRITRLPVTLCVTEHKSPEGQDNTSRQRFCLLTDTILNHTTRSTQVTSWEGAIKATGTTQGQPIHGQGYMELTGYAERFMQRL